MRTSRLLPLLGLAALLLAGCSGSSDDPADPPAGGQELTAQDDSFTLTVPGDWEAIDTDQEPVVLAAQGSDPLDQLIVSAFPSVEAAEEQAVSITAGLAGQDVACERLEDSDVYGEPRLLFDCPGQAADGTARRVLVPVDGDDRGLLLLLQTSGAALQDTAELGTLVLGSLTFR
jgi:hypothetical protein